MMLRTSTVAEKYFHLPNHCHGNKDIHARKEKIGVFQNMIPRQRITSFNKNHTL